MIIALLVLILLAILFPRFMRGLLAGAGILLVVSFVLSKVQ